MLARHQSKREVEFNQSLELSAILDVSNDEVDDSDEGNCYFCGTWTNLVLLGNDYLCATCFFAGNKIIFILFNIIKLYL